MRVQRSSLGSVPFRFGYVKDVNGETRIDDDSARVQFGMPLPRPSACPSGATFRGGVVDGLRLSFDGTHGAPDAAHRVHRPQRVTAG
ncbi:hypothetical protein [Kineococcus terrestris]|uniref:hypothetical protein n=1 Tax=Kineococcus terrestris TaxID=2044856 RepID=UPI0034DACD86